MFIYTRNQMVFLKELADWFLLLCNYKWHSDTTTTYSLMEELMDWMSFIAKQLSQKAGLSEESEIRVIATSHLSSSWGMRIKTLPYNVCH